MFFLGPVFRYDLTRLGRQGRYFILRSLFALVLFAILYVLFVGFAKDQQTYIDLQALARAERQALESRLPSRGPFPPITRTPAAVQQQVIQGRMAAFGEQFFSLYMFVQIAMLYLLTPALVGGVIAEEKQRKTMDFILTTELTRPEIVLGKLCSRMLVLTLLMLTGLPILSMVQLFGGINNELLWAGFLASLVLMLSLSSLSICLSVFARSVGESLLKSYLAVAGYFLVWGGMHLGEAMSQPGSTAAQTLAIVRDVYDWGNPLAALTAMREHVALAGTLGDKPWELLLQFTIFHGAIILFCLTLAVLQVRRVYVRQTHEAKNKPTETQSLRRSRAVSNWPMYWKERYCERTFRFGILGRTALALGLILLVCPGVVFAVSSLVSTAHTLDDGQHTNGYTRLAGMVFLFLILLAIGVRAASSFGLEKDRQTWECLLATPVPVSHILWAKWWHSLWGVRWLFLLLVLIWVCGIVSLSLHWVALPILILNSLAAMLLASAMGIYCSVRFPNTLRAMLMTVAGLVLLCVTPPVLERLMHDWRNTAPWRHTMNISPLRMAYVTAVCPKDNFEGWAQSQEYTRATLRGGTETFLFYPSSRLRREETVHYALHTLAMNMVPLLFACGFFLNAMIVLQRECGRIDYAKTKAMRIQLPPPVRHRPMARIRG
jgi:ABC-type transport system involved in multi-copper enzyme maturation permease subunit